MSPGARTCLPPPRWRPALTFLADETGATAVECTRVLETGGVRFVTLITFARALDARRLTT